MTKFLNILFMKKPIHRLRLILLPLCIVLLAQPVASQTNYPLDPAAEKDNITIPIPAANAIKLPSDRPFLVRSANNRISERHRNAIRITIPDSHLPLVNLEVTMSVFDTPGNYEVTFKYTDSGKQTQPLVLVLTRAVAVLDQPSTVHITMEGKELTKEALSLHEKGGGSGIPVLNYSTPIIQGVDCGGLMVFTPNSHSIQAGGFLSASYTVDKGIVSKLPLGTSKGKLWITAPQLQTPLAVDLEINHIEPKWLIILFVLLGLLLGGFVRHFLQDGRDFEEARTKGLAVVQQIEAESDKVEDKAYQKTVGDLLEPLIALLSKKAGFLGIGVSAADVTTKVNDTLAAYKKIRDGLLANLDQQRQSLLTFRSVFLDTTLDQELKGRLIEAISAFNNAAASLDKMDPTTASQQIDDGRKLTNQVLGRLEQYYNGYEALMSVVIPAEFAPETKLSLQQYFAGIKAEVAKMTAANVAIDVQMVSIGHIFDLKNDLWKDLLAQMDLVFRIDEGRVGADDLANFKKTLNDYRTGIVNISTDPKRLPDPGGYWPNGMQARLTESWNAVKPPAVAAMRGDRGFDLAAAEIPGDELQVLVADRVPLIAERQFARFSPVDIQALAKASRVNLIVYTVLRTILLALLMSLGAYRYYEATFTGSFDQLIGILLFAFSLDVTADGVATLRDKKS